MQCLIIYLRGGFLTTPIHLGYQPVMVDGISLNSREALSGGAEGNLELSSIY